MVSFASRNEGDDMDEKSCINLAAVTGLRPSRYGAMLLITARSAGYIAASFPWLVEMRL